MRNKIMVQFTLSEARHILNLVFRNKEDGTYHSSREQYWKRSDRIFEKLEDLEKELEGKK